MGICLHMAHKEIMIDRIKYLEEQKYIDEVEDLREAYISLKKDIYLIKMLLLRNKIQKRETIKEKNKYIDKLLIIKQKDIILTNQFRDTLYKSE